MEVASQQYPVIYLVRSVQAEWVDVSSFQGRKGVLGGNSAGSLVFIGNNYSESSLAKPWSDGNFFPVSVVLFLNSLSLKAQM